VKHDGWGRWLLLCLVAIASLGLAWAIKAPCRDPSGWNGKREYRTACYSDLVPLYGARGLDRGQRPYLDEPFEYPVLSGALAWVAAARGGGAKRYFDQLSIILAAAALVSVLGVALILGGPDRRAFAYALSPPLWLFLLQNFDQLAVAAAVLAVLALRRGRFGWAGVAFGLGAAAKLFPGVMGVGAALCLAAQRKWRDAARVGGGTLAAFALVNLPLVVASPGGFLGTYRFHAERVADWGSIVYWSSLHAGADLGRATRIADVIAALLFVSLLGLLTVWSRRRELPVETAAVFALAALLLTSKVWSPQFALWLLPFLVVLDLRMRWLVVASALETLGFVAKFQWFGSTSSLHAPQLWMWIYEASVWARFVFTAAFAITLLRTRPTIAGPSPAWEPFLPATETRRPRLPRRLGVALLAVSSVLFVVRLGSFGNPPDYVYDECYQAFTAHRYTRGEPEAWNPRASRDDAARHGTEDMTPSTSYEWVHPPTAKLIMAASIKLFGFRAWAYRFGSVLFGLLALVALWRLAARLRGEWYALIALALFACDGMLLVLSRTAMNDVYVTACLTAAMFAVYRFWTADTRRDAWLLAAGALFGLAITMKWSALALFVECGALTAARILWDRWRRDARDARMLYAWAAAFVLAPAAIYLLAYLPYFLAGHGWGQFVTLQREMIYYHGHLKAPHAYGSPWWSWPMVSRPVWFYSHDLGQGLRQVVYAFGNPLLWWAFLPSLAYVGARFLRTRAPLDALILLGFFGHWLPWMLVSRVGFIQFLLPAVPFGVLAVAAVLDDARHMLAAKGLWMTGLYLAVCLAAYVHFYPVWTALPLSAASLGSRRWLWFESWR
jgi:dolichyl-phosphate-mannose-protein mannosyltransferase